MYPSVATALVYALLVVVPWAMSQDGADSQTACQCHLSEQEPVCGTDGQTYDNNCEASCHNTNVQCVGKCPCPPELCICPFNFDPVCGANGVTYGNECQAHCAGQTVVCKGECDSCQNMLESFGGMQPELESRKGQNVMLMETCQQEDAFGRQMQCI